MVAFQAEPAKKRKKTHHMETFEDLAANSYKVTIHRIQQEALKRTNCKIPNPAEQLALIAERRKKKVKAKAKHRLCISIFSLPSMTLL